MILEISGQIEPELLVAKIFQKNIEKGTSTFFEILLFFEKTSIIDTK
jgi:hypothetical protein